jgi:hypothetical protein
MVKLNTGRIFAKVPEEMEAHVRMVAKSRDVPVSEIVKLALASYLDLPTSWNRKVGPQFKQPRDGNGKDQN